MAKWLILQLASYLLPRYAFTTHKEKHNNTWRQTGRISLYVLVIYYLIPLASNFSTTSLGKVFENSKSAMTFGLLSVV